MTPEEIQELRDWSARKMGWERGPYVRQISRNHINPVAEDAYFNKQGGFVCYVKDWLPDRPESGQIWMLVDRMRDLGWGLNYQVYQDYYVAYFQPLVRPSSELGASYNVKAIVGIEPCLAILKAARATEE